MPEQNKDSAISASTEIDFEVSDRQIVEEVLNAATLCEVGQKNSGNMKKQQIARVQDEAGDRLKRYYDSIAQVAGIVRERVNEKYPSAHILEFRTSLHPFSDGMKLFVVIDSVDLETDLHVGMVLSEIEKDLLAHHKIFCEIAYMRKAKYINGAAINEQYPLVVKV